MFPSFVHESFLLVGPAAGRRAGLDPPDQHDAAPPRQMGGHGVSAGQPEAASHLDPLQATVAVAAANGGGRRRGADAGAALVRNQWGALVGRHPDAPRDLAWTTAFRCRTIGPTPVGLRPGQTSRGAGWPRRPRIRTIRRSSRCCGSRERGRRCATRSPICRRSRSTPTSHRGWKRRWAR